LKFRPWADNLVIFSGVVPRQATPDTRKSGPASDIRSPSISFEEACSKRSACYRDAPRRRSERSAHCQRREHSPPNHPNALFAVGTARGLLPAVHKSADNIRRAPCPLTAMLKPEERIPVYRVPHTRPLQASRTQDTHRQNRTRDSTAPMHLQIALSSKHTLYIPLFHQQH